MNVTDIIVVLILIVLIAIGLKSTIKHMKGQGSCCGGSEVVKEPDKELDNPILGQYTIKIEGMTCENCVNRIKRALNRMDGISAKVYLKKKCAIVSYNKTIDMNDIIQTINNLGYSAKQ